MLELVFITNSFLLKSNTPDKDSLGKDVFMLLINYFSVFNAV